MLTTAPIFVVGCPRSGNTLVACILNKHPDLLIHFELNLFNVLKAKWGRRISSGNQADWAFRETIYEHVANCSLKGLDLPLDSFFESIEPEPSSWGEMLDGFMRLVIEYSKPSATQWGDKTPHQVAHMHDIQQTYRRARFIYVYRDPRHTVASLSSRAFPHASRIPIINAEVVRHYDRIYRAERERVNVDRIFELRYESLTAAPMQTLMDLCSFLGVNFTSKLLEPAPICVRRKIGWENYKGWETIARQESQTRFRIPQPVRAYLRPMTSAQGYTIGNKPGRVQTSIGFAGGILFRSLSRILDRLRRLKRPGAGPLLVNRIPTKREIRFWLVSWLNPSR